MRTLKQLAFVTAGFAYAVIVIGYLVRITGSGMGCGPDWPLCNGRLIPTFTSASVAIEWTHRLAVLGLSVLTLATVVTAWLQRAAPGGHGPGGTARPAAAIAVLFVVQSLLGRQAVVLDLEAVTVVTHLGIALAILAILVVLSLRAGVHAGTTVAPPTGASSRVLRRTVLSVLILGAVVLLLGGLTANLGAMGACVGFPLCSGHVWPAAALGRLHWAHRLAAYALFVDLVWVAVTLERIRAPRPLLTAAWLAVGAVTIQIIVAIVMVTAGFPPVWRTLHAVVGTAVWVALVWLGWLARRNEVPLRP